jgi:hypothetical protein
MSDPDTTTQRAMIEAPVGKVLVQRLVEEAMDGGDMLKRSPPGGR